MKLIIDSNIVFSSLLSKNNNSKLILVSKKFDIYSCNFMFVEIFKHKRKIQSLSKLNEEDLLLQLEKITSRINFVKEEIIPKKIYNEAYNLCKNIDEKDTPFVALTLCLNGYLLTGDKKLFNKLKEINFNVINLQEIKKII